MVDRDNDPTQTDKQRTLQQNRALHKLFELIADSLNDAGYDMRRGLRADIDVPWSPDTVKEYLWRPVQKAQLRKDSTTELTTKEIDEVFDTLNRHFGEKFGLNVPFPSIEQTLLDKQAKERNG